MKLITEYGELPLPDNISISITKSSPFFSDEGEQSLPISIPGTEVAHKALNYPLRIGSTTPIVRELEAVLQIGRYNKRGTLVFDSFTQKTFTAAMAFAESDIYANYSDMKISDLFANYIRDDYASYPNPVEAWVNHLYNCSANTRDDDFNVFPTLVTKNEADFILNEVDSNSESYPWQLIWQARNIGDELVPDGYGITPFLYLRKLIDRMFEQMGYRVTINVFETNAMLRKLVLLNNNADSICRGNLNYSHIVPTCTVGEFIEFLDAHFKCAVIVKTESKTVDVIPFINIAGESYNISDIMTNDYSVNVSDASRVVLSCDTSLEGAAPPTTSLLEFVEKYPEVHKADEEDFIHFYRYSALQRLATGEFFLVHRNIDGGLGDLVRIGSNYFNYDANNTVSFESISSVAVMPVMIEIYSLLNSIFACYVGSVNHHTTSYNDEEIETGDQSIILALDAGIAANDDKNKARYRLATTQAYNNLGVKIFDFDLTFEFIYREFWQQYNGLLKSNYTKVSGVVNFSLSELESLPFDKFVIFNNYRLLPLSLNYTLNKNGVVNGNSEFVFAKLVENDPIVNFEAQKFYWSYRSNIYDRAEELETFYAFVDFEWLNTSGDIPFYLAPPAALGLIVAEQMRPVRIKCYNQFEELVQTIEEDTKCWFVSESVPTTIEV